MTTFIYVKSHEESWKVENDLKKEGYVKVSDCMWRQHLKKDNDNVYIGYCIKGE